MAEAVVNVRFEPPSEGLAELIERLAVATFKRESIAPAIRDLCERLPPEVVKEVRGLVDANFDLYALKDEQTRAVLVASADAHYLLGLLRRDIELCQARARIRGELNRRLGAEVSSESLKQYGREGR